MPQNNEIESIARYISELISLDHPILEEITQKEINRTDIQPSVGAQVGKLLGLLVRVTHAKKVLEFGTCQGYSTIWLAQALRTTAGKLTSVEYDQSLFKETQTNIAAAGVSSIVNLIHGDASEVIKGLDGPFDIILQDSDKRLYPELLEICIQKTRLNGLLIADDALFLPKGIPKKFSTPVHEYNRRVFSDPRLYSTILPIGDGLTLSVKISE